MLVLAFRMELFPDKGCEAVCWEVVGGKGLGIKRGERSSSEK